MSDRNIDIVLVEYLNRNLGDSVIAECARFFLEKALFQAGIENYCIHDYNLYLEDMEFIRHADVIVFAGGGLIKYKGESFYKYIPQIVDTAEKYRIPVYFNCVGVEGYSAADEKCAALKHAVNCNCVKGLTIRDDYQTFVRHYLTVEKEWLGEVWDVASFASEVYGIARQPGARKIGLGVARAGLFFDYGFPSVSKQAELDFWKGVILRLEQMGIEWEIFNNGLHSDHEFGLEVLEYADIRDKENYIVKRPAEGAELVRTISRYRGIIAERMHTNIIAYSLGVPSVGLVWNEKLVHWGRRNGYPERVIRVEEMQAELAVERLQRAMAEGCRPCGAKEQAGILEPLTGFLKKYAVVRAGRYSEKIDWEKRLFAAALGGKNGQFAGMNSPDTIMEKYDAGFRMFEADLKWTSDMKLICANGWTESTLSKLGCSAKETPMLRGGMSYQRFMEAKYYDGHYRVMDWEMLVQYISELKDARFILDIRNNTREQMELLRRIIGGALKQYSLPRHQLILKIMKREELTAVSGLGVEIMYELPTEAEMEEYDIQAGEVDALCRDEAVRWLAVRKTIYGQEGIERLNGYHKKICVACSNSAAEVREWLSAGADIVGTDHLSVAGLKSLFSG